ncbi:MAG: hypothetical protein GC159_14600 [Phycisphaera sp.]|nr:hypothetical protein [Phycisphaera sp.]
MNEHPDNPRRCNLVLVWHGNAAPRSDMERIAERIHARWPHIRVLIARRRPRLSTWLRCLLAPTCVVSFHPVTKRWWVRGRLFDGYRIDKHEQNTIFSAAGLPVPEWAVISPGDDTPDVTHLGAYVVTKPDCGGQGADVLIRRSSRVRYREPKTDMARMLAERYDNADMIVQRFVYTGPHARCYRVTTLFGRTIFAWLQEASHDRPPLEGPDAFGGGGHSIVSSGKGCTFTLIDDPDIIELAERAHATIPHIPLLGVDIVREQPSGRLYILEVNPNGYTWHLGSKNGQKIQRESGFDIAAQFSGYDVAAEALADVAMRHAC